MNIQDATAWAEEVFGNCDLGDPRRLVRLVDYASRQASDPKGSTMKVCAGNAAAEEGAYRFLRNKHVQASDIDKGVFRSTAKLCEGEEVVLVVQDSSSTEVSHKPLRDELEENGCPTGWMVHSALAVSGKTGAIIGLLDQERWVRPHERPGKKARRERAYEDKESFKWQSASERVIKLVKRTSNLVTVCDREGDIFEYILFHVENSHRYVIRCSLDRRTAGKSKLWADMEAMPLCGTRKIVIEQRGASPQKKGIRPARKKRTVDLEVRAGNATILCPKSRKVAGATSLTMNVVYVKEIGSTSKDPLVWRLFTSEPIDTFKGVEKIISFYEKRWLIEEFHKCWKTGCRAEERSLQSLEALDRFYAISAPIAIRMMQLKNLLETEPENSCETALDRDEWQCLHATLEPRKPIPKKAPNIRWAYYSIAKLGGWIDTKRTGRVGCTTMWDGWQKLLERVEGWRLAKSAYARAQGDL